MANKNIYIYFQLDQNLGIIGVDKKFRPIADKYLFEEHGAGTDLTTMVRDISGDVPEESIPEMLNEIRAEFGKNYLKVEYGE
jgi:hypothetical protein